MNINELKTIHGDVFEIEIAEYKLAYRRARRFEYKDFLKKITNDKSNLADCQERLCYDCIVYPEKTEVNVIFDKYPGGAGILAGEIIQLAQGQEAEHSKKL